MLLETGFEVRQSLDFLMKFEVVASNLLQPGRGGEGTGDGAREGGKRGVGAKGGGGRLKISAMRQHKTIATTHTHTHTHTQTWNKLGHTCVGVSC